MSQEKIPFFLTAAGKMTPGGVSLARKVVRKTGELGPGLVYTTNDDSSVVLSLKGFSKGEEPWYLGQIYRNDNGSWNIPKIIFAAFIIPCIVHLFSGPKKDIAARDWAGSITESVIPDTNIIDIGEIVKDPFFQATFDSIMVQDILKAHIPNLEELIAGEILVDNISMLIGEKRYKIHLKGEKGQDTNFFLVTAWIEDLETNLMISKARYTIYPETLKQGAVYERGLPLSEYVKNPSPLEENLSFDNILSDAKRGRQLIKLINTVAQNNALNQLQSQIVDFSGPNKYESAISLHALNFLQGRIDIANFGTHVKEISAKAVVIADNAKVAATHRCRHLL